MNADLETYYGRIASHWKHEGGHLILDVTIPINTTATVYIPAPEAGETTITEGDRPLSAHPEIRLIGRGNGYAIVEIGSGNYHFQN
jgi:alpha-L-rhamnosidase